MTVTVVQMCKWTVSDMADTKHKSKYKTLQSPELLQILACVFSSSGGFHGQCKILLGLGYLFAQVPLFSVKSAEVEQCT